MITSLTNSKIKHVVQLTTSAKARREERLYIVEGERMVREIPVDEIVECYVSEGFVAYDCIPDGVQYETVSEAVFKKMSDTMTPQGVLCVVRFSDRSIDDFMSEHKDGILRLLVLESVQDPGNLGTMIRTAEGAGFDGIIADGKTADVYNPKVTRATMGSMFRMPVIYIDDLHEILGMLQQDGVKLCGTHLKGTKSYMSAEYGDRVAVIIGNEGRGMTDATSDMCDLLVKIPMSGKVESLNASVAAALMMYEVNKSRLI